MVKPVKALIASFVIVIAAMLMFTVVGALFDASDASLGDGASTASVGINDTTATFDSGTVTGVDRVRTSLNDSLALDGTANSELAMDTDANLEDSFSVCTYAEADSSVVSNNEARLLLSTQQAQLQYNGTDDVWQGRYTNVSNGSAWHANVSATSPSTPTLVCLNRHSGAFNISANTTTGADVATTGTTSAALLNGSNWNGNVDETRMYETVLNGSQRTDYVAEPVLAVDGGAPAARVTYDQFNTDLSDIEVYFSDTSASATSASVAGGRAGPAISDGVDYEINGGDITVLSGSSTLDTQGEVLYINYGAGADETGELWQPLFSGIESFSGIVALVPLILITVAIISLLKRA